MKYVGIILLLMTGALVGLWFAYVRAPAPEAVCQHYIEIAVAEAGDHAPDAMDSLVQRLKMRCVEEKQRLLKLRGKIHYASYAKCVMAATSLGEAERC